MININCIETGYQSLSSFSRRLIKLQLQYQNLRLNLDDFAKFNPLGSQVTVNV